MINLLTVVSFAIFLAGTTPAYAYLDPGTGTIIVQAIIGSIAAGAAAIGVYWNSARKYFSKKDRKGVPSAESADKRKH